MGRKKVLEKRKQRLEQRRAALMKRSEESQDANELKTIYNDLQKIAEDIQDVVDELEAIAGDDNNDPDKGKDDPGSGDDDGTGEERTASMEKEKRMTTKQTFSYGKAAGTEAGATGEARSILDTLEYRNAFANYVKTGATEAFADLEERAKADGMVITSDVGKVIPNTIMSEFIKRVGSYGQLYEKVRKLQVRGGVEFPIEQLVPEVRWISETTVPTAQVAPEIKTSISFGYYIAEARISQSLLASIITLDVLEKEIATILAEAFAKEFDRFIISGSGTGQPTGILNDARVKEENKLTFDTAEMADWKTWRKKLFAKIPLKYRGQGILIMTAGTWESNIMTLKDDNNNPIYKETYDVNTGDLKCRFNGREVILVEPDILKDYESANQGEAFAIYLKPTDYAVNTQLQIGFKRYYNDDKEQWVNKGLCIVDGKLLDVNGVFILKKGETVEG